jgi:hypothetical protein
MQWEELLRTLPSGPLTAHMAARCRDVEAHNWKHKQTKQFLTESSGTIAMKMATADAAL